MKKTKMLKKNNEFKYVLGKGKYYSGKYIEAFIKENNKNINLLGLAISTKVGKAVRRNKIKRLIRESYKISEKDIETGNSIIFLWKKSKEFENANFTNILEDINYILKKANILKNKEI